MTNNLKAERTLTAGEFPKTELERAANALLNNLWQKVYSGSRTFEENWDAMERTYPASKWLQDELKAIRSQSLSAQQPMGEELSAVRDAARKMMWLLVADDAGQPVLRTPEGINPDDFADAYAALEVALHPNQESGE